MAAMIFALIVGLCFAAPSSAPDAVLRVHPGQSGAPSPSSRTGTPERPIPVTGTALTGVASWGDFHGHVVTRLPRGTSIFVQGQQGGWTGSSWGYGPQERTKRIVDLDVTVFEMICGPRKLGLCEVTLWSNE